MGLGITGFSLWQSTKWYHGLAFTGGILAAFGLLAGVAKILTQVARKVISRSWPYVWRQGLANLHRPNNRTTLLMLSLGLGTFLVLTMFLVQQTLLVDLLPSGHGRQPNTVLFDVQSDQIEGVERLLKDRDLEILQRSPVVTMRLASVKGRAIGDLLKAPDRQRAPNWVLRREFRSTWRDQLVDTEESVAGHWPAERAQDVTPISLESGIAKDLGVTIGDDLVFDVQGVPITTRVAHLRNVDWRRMSPNFFVVFPSNSLEAAPAFHILTTRTPTAAAGAEMHHELIGTFPNISLIDLTLVLKTVDVIISKISLAVRFMAMFILGTGFLVLVAAILTGRVPADAGKHSTPNPRRLTSQGSANPLDRIFSARIFREFDRSFTRVRRCLGLGPFHLQAPLSPSDAGHNGHGHKRLRDHNGDRVGDELGSAEPSAFGDSARRVIPSVQSAMLRSGSFDGRLFELIFLVLQH